VLVLLVFIFWADEVSELPLAKPECGKLVDRFAFRTPTESEKKVKTIFTTVVLLLMCAAPCLAQLSECNSNATPCEAYANADAVFVAKVTRIRPETFRMWQTDKDYDQIANLIVEKTYKGIARNSVVLHQLGRKNAPKFIQGSRYLFYANYDRATKKWEVRRCGRTLMAQYAHDDLYYLNGLPASAKKTRIAGEVIRYENDEENPQGTNRRLAGVRIKITGAGEEYEVVTDANGMYEIYGAAAGSYVIQPVIPSGLVLMGVMHYGPFDRSQLRSLKIELKEGACSGATILLTPNRKIAKPNIGN